MRNMYIHTTTYADREVESRTTYTPAIDTTSITTISNEMYDNFCRKCYILEKMQMFWYLAVQIQTEMLV